MSTTTLEQRHATLVNDSRHGSLVEAETCGFRSVLALWCTNMMTRRNTAMSSVNVNGDHESCPLEFPLPRFSCAEYGGVQFDEELVCSSALCARDGVNYFIAVKNNPREVVMVMMEEVFRQQQRSSRVKKHDNDASSPSSDDDDDDEGATLVTVKPCPEVDEEYAYLSSSGFLVLAPSTGGAVQVYDLLSADCKLVASLELPENITSLDYRTVETRGDALVITTSENERHQEWILLTIGKPGTAGDATLLPTATMRSLHTSDVYDATKFEVVNKGTGVMDVRGFSRRAVLVPSGGVAIVMNTSGDSLAMNKFVYYDVSSTSVTHTWDFPADTSIEEFLVCRNQEGSLVVAAYDGTRVYLKNAADGTDLVKPVEQTQYRCMSAAANEQLFFIHTRDAVEVYSTSLKGPTLEDHLQATVLGDFYTAIISSDGLLLACDCYNEWLLTTTTGSGLCTIASPQNDIVVTVTNSTTVTLNVATWKLGCEDCTTRGLFCQKRVTQGRYAECVGSHEVLLPGAPRALHLTEDATLLVVHSADGQILLFDTSAATSARQKQRKPSSTAAAVGDDVTELCELESELQRSLSAVRRIHTDGIGEQVRYSLVRCSTSSSGVTGVVGLVRGECVYNIEHGATLTAHIVYVHKGSVVGYETLSLLSKVPRSMLQPIPISADDSLCCSCHVCDCNSEEDDFGTSAEAREIPPMFDMELGDEEGSVVNVEDIALNCDGTILAVWLRRHSKVLVFPVSRNLAAQCSDEAVEGTKALEALILEPSPLLAEVYIDASMRSSCTGRLQFLAAEPCALVRYSRPSQHWTYHIEQWDLSPKQQQQLTMITTTSVEAPAVVSMGDNKEDEASLALEPKPRALDNQLEEENKSPTDFIYTEPVRTDRVGYMSGDPALCSLVMSASGNHMTHLSTNGVSLYRRAPSGDDNDEEANRFFWWSAFVADLYAPSEYLLIPCLCLVFGCISSIVVTAMNAEGFSGFISRVVNGSTLQNWVDVVTVFVCRSVIVRSEFLPICGDAVAVIVSSNDPVVRGQERKDLSWNLLVGQAFFVVLYPVYIYMFPGLAYVMSSLNPLLFVVGFFGYLAAVFLVVRRSFDRTRKVAAIAAAPSNSTTSDKPPMELPQRTFSQRWSSWTHIISTNVHFYAVILRLFLLAFIMMISCNFTLQVATRMSTNAGLMMMGSGDYARYYDPCLQYSNTPCDTCTAHSGCSYCATSRQCVGSSRSDSPCGAIESAGTRECYAYSNATCALYDDDGPFCVGWSNCAYCSASGNCTRTFESNCSVPIVTATNHSFSPTYFTTNSTNSDKWWGNLPYLSDDTVAYAQLLFYELQISSGTCSAARVTETTWANANYITSLF
ncbi:transmembrane protein, putative [Bodo saltans]|uniref:Transmembrane protein, putative n=1 Tax=Bodo saltans TaxID=75058 RepID=A0A0S4JLR5_BODSA|nr:transmembrane protein, putative [Bodo saltans]|eukprot:CUG91338.1 transmembrane protein, putative [Bodo saltans]